MDAGWLRALYTVFMFLAFIGIVIWAWSSRRKKDFEEAANLPLHDDDESMVTDTDNARDTIRKNPGDRQS